MNIVQAEEEWVSILDILSPQSSLGPSSSSISGIQRLEALEQKSPKHLTAHRTFSTSHYWPIVTYFVA